MKVKYIDVKGTLRRLSSSFSFIFPKQERVYSDCYSEVGGQFNKRLKVKSSNISTQRSHRIVGVHSEKGCDFKVLY